MKPSRRLALRACSVAAGALLIVSCETVNELGRFKTEGATVAVNMRAVPEPTFNVSYHVSADTHNPVLTAVSIGTNIAKADQASKAEALMREALARVDIAGIVRQEAYEACLATLGARREDSKRDADYILDLDVRDYGIDADSAVSLRVKLTASLYSNARRELVWRRAIEARGRAEPQMFGVRGIVGDIVTIAILADMTEEELARGFEKLARDSAKAVARIMQDDLYSARYR